MIRNNLKNYCVLPFNSVSITANGEIRHCCNGGYDLTNAPLLKELSVDLIINNDFIQDIRDSFIKDERHPKCSRCWDMEDMGIMSFREVANRYKNYALNKTGIPNTNRETRFEHIEYIDLTLGNKCNLACRMCQPSSSSLLAKQEKEMGLYSGEINLDHSSDNKEKILDLFRKAKNLKSIYMLGGEPLINDFHFEILDLLIANGKSRNIEIHFNTNLQVNKVDSYYDRWEKFSKVRIQASIDGAHDCYEYIRYPGKWNKIYKNFQELSKIIDNKKYYFSISPVLQNLNAHNIFDLINEMRYTNNSETSWFFIPISGPNQLHLLPKKTLKKCIKKANNLPVTSKISKNDIISQLTAAYNKKIDVKDLELFFSMTKRYDKYRKQNLFEMAPHFAILAEQYSIETW